MVSPTLTTRTTVVLRTVLERPLLATGPQAPTGNGNP